MVKNLSPFLQSTHRFGEPLPRRVAVFRALQLGDVLCAVPALRALRATLPQAEITFIGLPWGREFTARFRHYVNDFLEFPGFPGLPERPPEVTAFPDFLRQTQDRSFDLAIQLHGSGSYVNSIVGLLGARRTAGFFVSGDWCPDPERYLPYPEDESEVVRLVRLMEFLGTQSQGTHLDFPVTPWDETALRAIPETQSLLPGSFACVHPGARWNSRRWPAERFAAVGDRLARQGLQMVLTGSREERPLAAEVKRRMRAPAINLAGRTSLGALGALLTKARLLICNDTGISHVAAALRLPSVVVTMGSDPARWAPEDHERHRAVYAPVDCRPCAYRECPIGHPCALDLEADQVAEEAEDLLNSALLAVN